jgi:hypothetical protein
VFDSPQLLQAPLRARLEWCLEEAKAVFEEGDRTHWLWILKPSVTNKGADISVLPGGRWGAVLDALEGVPAVREWVLQVKP